MADYIYLLDNRLSPAQRAALRTVRELARSRNVTVFLVGGAVRDLTSGSPVRDLDVVVQGNALKLKGDLEKAGAVMTGELAGAQSLFAVFPGSVRVEIGSTLSVTWPKPGKPVYKPAPILDDLRRRDFTANAMALSLNEGSYGLLMDPLNGIADIENRELRLVSNYGFIEDPVRMVRASRLMARLGWALDEKTQQRYETGKAENYIAALTEQQRGYELEEIVHEEDPLRVMTRLEAEGWLQILAPYWSVAKADTAGLEHLREVQTQLQMQGIHPDASAANFPLLTAKLAAKDVATLKSAFVRQGFVKEIESLEQKAKDLAGLLNGKTAVLPSQTWQILTAAAPEAVLWVAYSSKSAALQAKFKSFSTVWPQARQKIPYALLQEMRIVPELPVYEELLTKLFFELMDDKLQAPEEMKAFLEPYSPPAPPPPVNTRRPRASKKEAKGKGRGKKAPAIEFDPDADEGDGELPDEIEPVSAGGTGSTDDEADVPTDEPSGEEADELDEAPERVLVDEVIAGLGAFAPQSEPEAVSSAIAVGPKVKVASKPKKQVAPKAEAVTTIIEKPATAKLPPAKSAAVAASVKIAAAKPAPSKETKKTPIPARPVASSVPAKSGKAAVKPQTAGRSAAKTQTVRAFVAQKPPAKKVPAKAVPPKKTVPTKVTAGKAAVKKPQKAPAKALAKKVAGSKVPPQKAAARKQSPAPKSASKKPVSKAVPRKKRR